MAGESLSGSKRPRDEQKTSRKKRRERYFTIEPSVETFSSVTGSITSRVKDTAADNRRPSRSLREDVFTLCEDIHHLVDTFPTWNEAALQWTLQFLLISPSLDQPKLSITEATLSRKYNDFFSPIVLLMTDCLYTLHFENTTKLKEIIVSHVDKFQTEEATVWIAAWLGIHFPTIVVPHLLSKFLAAVPAILTAHNATTTTEADISSLIQSLKIHTLVEALEYLCQNLNTQFEQIISDTLQSNTIQMLYGSLMFLPGVVTLCNRAIVSFIRQNLSKLVENREELRIILSCLFMRLSCFRASSLQLVRCVLQLPEEFLTLFINFLKISLDSMDGSSTEFSIGIASLQQHIQHMRSAIIPLCMMSLDSSLNQEQQTVIISYLQLLCIQTDETAALEVLFRLFIIDGTQNIPIFFQLFEYTCGHYNRIPEQFMERLLSYIPLCNERNLPQLLSSLVFISKREAESNIAEIDSLGKHIAKEENFELLVSYMQHKIPEVRVLAFELLQGIALWVRRDPVVVFVTVQKLVSCLFTCMASRSKRISVSGDSPSQIENTSQMIHYVTSLIKELSCGDIIALQVIDLLLDISFSERASGILRKRVSGIVPPANSLVLPEPTMLHFSVLSDYTTDNEDDVAEGMIDANKTRRLFSKDMQQDKVIPPPVAASIDDIDRKKQENFMYLENQQIFLEIVDYLLQQTPSNYTKFTDILLTRLTSPYAVPSDEQYLEILPRHSNYDFDIFVRKVFIQNPIFVGFLSILAQNPMEFMKCFVIVKSLLANMIGDWNITTHSGNDPDHVLVTIELLKVLKQAHWLPSGLEYCHEILPLIPSADGTIILMNLWKFIRENPPKRSELVDNDGSKTEKTGRELEYKRYQSHLHSIRQVLYKHINVIAPFYSNFFPKASLPSQQ